MRRSFRYCMLALALVGVVACGSDNAKKDTLPEFEPFTLAVEDDSISVSICYQRIANVDANPIFTTIEEQNYANSFDGYAVEPMSVEASAQLLMEDYSDSVAWDVDGGSYFYTMDQKAHLERDDSILCYETYIESYIGGAHGGYSLWFECFDLTTGQLYDFAYLVDGEWGTAVRELICARLNEVEPVNFIDSIDMLPAPSNALITKDGLTIVYQPYAVACFAAGIISLEFTDAELAATGAPLVWVAEE
ncbi:MAG: DUF3298 domain-containing protein [Alistipes sp.]|nr:DUF3298 domain-containing protein [Alistipes sp.]